MEVSCNSKSVHGSRLKVPVIDKDYETFRMKGCRLLTSQSFTAENN